jgi:hypothetical protein
MKLDHTDRQRLLLGLVIGAGVLIGSLYFGAHYAAAPVPSAGSDEEKAAVAKAVTDFGAQLNFVSLTAAPDIAIKAMEDHYAPFVSAELLDAWKKDLERAPGRLTSNPHPDRIEIRKMERNEDGSYEVGAKVIEVVSGSDAVVSNYPVALKLRFRDGKWIITGFAKVFLQPQ